MLVFIEMYYEMSTHVPGFQVQGSQTFEKSSKPCHVGIHWIDLAEYSQMSTHVPGFQSFLTGFFASFCDGQISHQQPLSKNGLVKMQHYQSNLTATLS